MTDHDNGDHDNGDHGPGKILYSDQWETDLSGVTRADYGLPDGVAALMDESLEFEPEPPEVEPERASGDSGQPGSRARSKWLLAVGLFLAVSVGVGMGALMRAGGLHNTKALDAEDGEATVRLRQFAEKLARGSLDELLKDRALFLGVFRMQGDPSPALWEGVRRLCHVVEMERGDARCEMALRILQAVNVRKPPEGLVVDTDRLKRLATAPYSWGQR